MEKFSTPEEVRRIAALPEAVIRNYQITQSYHILSRVLTSRIGSSANWCTFATWASRQAGQTIRHEDLARTLELKLANIPELAQILSEIADHAILKGTRLTKHTITRLIWNIIDPGAAMKRAGIAVARGNQKVHAEIAFAFAQFIEKCLGDTQYQALHIEAFCATLRHGLPPNGQQYLRQAFMRYYQAMYETDPKVKSELIFFANLEIGFHEQTRLQPDIAEALEASIIDPQEFKAQLLQALFPRQSWISSIGSIFTRLTGRPTTLDRAITDFAFHARRRIRLFLTEHLMILGLPDEMHLRLGEDHKQDFPASLQKLQNPELIRFLALIDSTPDSRNETGAVDWANLPDRMHFIADLFRCYQESPELFQPPFNPMATDVVINGGMPE